MSKKTQNTIFKYLTQPSSSTDVSPNETNTQNHSTKESDLEKEKKNEQLALEKKNSVPKNSSLETENGVKFK